MTSPRLLRSLAAASFAALLALGLAPAKADPVRTEHVEAELVPARDAIVPGAPFTVALRLKLESGWHTYWQNPGDSGLPTTLAWTLPQGFAAGPIQWPAPKALAAGPLVNYGFEGEVLYPVEIVPGQALADGAPVTLKARADWLVCRETCIPEGADLALTLPVAASAAPTAWDAPIALTQQALPRPLAGWKLSAHGERNEVRLSLVPPAGSTDPGALRFFAFERDRIEPSGAQRLTADGRGYVLTLPVSNTLTPGFVRVAGVLTAARGLVTPTGSVGAATIDVPLAGAVVAGPRPDEAVVPTLDLAPKPGGERTTLAVAIGLAFLGGLLLNLMPCVFPVLSLKVLSFARNHDSKATLRAEAATFAAGVLLTFLVLGFALASLRGAGEALGWGFQLQSPAVVTALALLFFALALNLSGVFEFGQLVPAGLAGWTSRNRSLDAFVSGILVVVIASPCTAPFMGAALGFALAGSKAVTFGVFAALGAGMAIPYVLLAWFPSWRRHMPRSGAWLQRLKQVLAFPLYATVIWLAWVLGAQRDQDAMVRLLLALLALGFALWAWHVARMGGAKIWAAAAAGAVVATGALAWPLASDSPPASVRAAVASAEPGWEAYSPDRLAALRASGRTVFVDFTAAWCVTCQVNKRLVLHDDAVRAGFARGQVALLRADWTRRDPVITEALAQLGRNGVPVYVVYRPNAAAHVLPEILQREIVLDAIGQG